MQIPISRLTRRANQRHIVIIADIVKLAPVNRPRAFSFATDAIRREGSNYPTCCIAFSVIYYLQGFYGNPYNVPLAAGMDYWGPTTPNSAFAFPVGQAISRTTYAPLFALIGTTFGTGDGSSTFNLPDKSGRISAMKEASATRLTSSYFGGNSTTLGAVGGSESHTLTTAQLASHAHSNTLNDPGHVHSYNQPVSFGASGSGAGITGSAGGGNTGTGFTGMSINNTAAGGGGAHNNVQATIICNYIIRVL
jgi:microcystin-dependent protein